MSKIARTIYIHFSIYANRSVSVWLYDYRGWSSHLVYTITALNECVPTREISGE